MKILFSFIFCFLISSVTSAGTYNYAEIGLGVSKLIDTSDDKEYVQLIDDVDPSAAFKLSTGVRLGRSPNVWFDLTYLYESDKDIGVNKINHHYLLTSIKFSTDPRSDFSGFFKLGGGRVFFYATQQLDDTQGGGSVSITGKSLVYSASIGSSFRLNPKQSITFEAQTLLGKNNKDSFNNFFTISLNQFL
ncbi:MAG: hypothetical protein ACJASH_000913 [Bermanella sp.]|jgi:hypothetical protein